MRFTYSCHTWATGIVKPFSNLRAFGERLIFKNFGLVACFLILQWKQILLAAPGSMAKYPDNKENYKRNEGIKVVIL